MPTALITGITGQDGSHLAEFLLSKGYSVVGMVRRSSTVNFQRIEHIQDQIELVPGDLFDQMSMVDALREFQPDEVYNLAAQSFVPTSWRQPVFTGEATALGVTRVLEAIRMRRSRYSLLSGLLVRDVWQGARDATERGHALLSTIALRRGQSVRALDHDQLSGEL